MAIVICKTIMSRIIKTFKEETEFKSTIQLGENLTLKPLTNLQGSNRRISQESSSLRDLDLTQY